jgi:AcrR family transcriptional regulator
MIIYIRAMRKKDEIKQDALFKATVKLVNEIGFVSSSVSKIAREAGISPATIYIDYKNKEDLLVSTYMDIKRDLIKAILADFNDTRPIRDIFKKIWFNMFDYIHQNKADFQFTEQFANSPYTSLIDPREMDQMFMPIVQVIQRGIEQKIIKNVDFTILSAFIYYPIYTLSNSRIHSNFEMSKENIEAAFTLAWDAIKL